MRDLIPITIRLPASERDWLRGQAEANFTSLNTEIIKALRENRERIDAEQERRAKRDRRRQDRAEGAGA
jgi:Arc-like DNA binding domain